MSDISINLEEYVKLVSDKNVFMTFLIIFGCLSVFLLGVIGIILFKSDD